MSYLLNETMTSTPAGTIIGNASYIASSYVQLTPNAGSQTGQLQYTLAIPTIATMQADIYANGGADANYIYWGCSSTPTDEDAGAGGYIVTADEYENYIMLQFNGTILTSVGTANLGNATKRTLEVDVNGTNILVYLAGTLIINYTDITRTMGGSLFGVGARTGGVSAEHRLYRLAVSVPDPVATRNSVVPSVPSRQLTNILARYVVEIYDISGNMLADLSGLASLDDLLIQRSDSQSATFSMDLFAFEKWCRNQNILPTDVLKKNSNEVRIRRYNRYVFAGQIYHTDWDISSGQTTVTVYVGGWLDVFAQRYTANNVTYTTTDAGSIAWGLINTSQGLTNGSIGITQGSITTSTSRTITYQQKSVKDAIMELSAMAGGFDFEITWNKIFNVFYPNQGTDHTTDLLFFYPGGNIKEIHLPEDATQMGNDIFARGTGQGNATLNVEVSDSSYAVTYYLRQKLIDLTTIGETANLTDYANSELTLFKPILTLPKIVLDGNQDPPLGSYWVGDRITIETRGLQSLNTILEGITWKIDAIEVRHDQDEQEEVTLTLSLP